MFNLLIKKVTSCLNRETREINKQLAVVNGHTLNFNALNKELPPGKKTNAVTLKIKTICDIEKNVQNNLKEMKTFKCYDWEVP